MATRAELTDAFAATWTRDEPQAESIGAELVVVGARGRTALSLLRLGSVAVRVVAAPDLE